MIVIPMAGLSARFSRAGYDVPKYMLPLHGSTVFDYSVATFQTVFDTEEFLFVATYRAGLTEFFEARLSALGVRRYRVELLEATTRGQAETVMTGLDRVKAADDAEVTIFNIDTFGLAPYEPLRVQFPNSAGVLQVFRGTGDNWSFVEPDPATPGRVLRTTEKVPISDLCCTGLYQFASVAAFREAYARELAAPQSSELFVAPIYNHLIGMGRVVSYATIAASDVVFCGVPSEYEALLAAEFTSRNLSR